MFNKGDKVKVNPISYPYLQYEGEISRKTKNGYSIMYNNNGLWFKSTFTQNELTMTIIKEKMR